MLGGFFKSKNSIVPTNDQDKQFIHLHQVVKEYQTAAGTFTALKGINFLANRGEFIAIVGKSGSGKSTLINMLTGIDRPTSGTISIGETPVHTLTENQMATWRGKNLGIVFQFFQLLPTLTVIENIMLPMDFCDIYNYGEREKVALGLLEQVGLVNQAYKLPTTLSGGQQQRAAIARSLANDPPVLVADEPTGNLDSKTAKAIFNLFGQLVELGKTIVMVTHDDDLAKNAQRVITITDGEIVSDKVKS